MVAWRRRPHKTSRPRKPELHARAPAFPADAIKLRDTFGAQLYSAVVIEVRKCTPELLKDFYLKWTPTPVST